MAYNPAMKLISWNVNGLRACLKKGFESFVLESGADAIGLEEIKGSASDFSLDLPGYTAFYNPAQRKGYSGTALLYKKEPLDIYAGIGVPDIDAEGRVITAEYDDFYFITTYVPNAQEELKRIDYRLHFDEELRNYLTRLREKKGVIVTGDLNVARNPIDLKNPKGNTGNPGYSKEERDSFELLLATGLIDSYRYYYPDLAGVYSWWSYRFRSREKNIGWRIDYFLVSEELQGKMTGAGILTSVLGSDHAPVYLDLAD